MIEVNGGNDAESLTEMANHIFSVHASCDPNLVGPMLEHVEMI